MRMRFRSACASTTRASSASAASYKQLMASFGSFSMDTLTRVDARAREQLAGRRDLHRIEGQISSLTDQRNALAADIRTGLNQAEFGGRNLSENQIRAWIASANDLLAQAHALANGS